MRMVTATKHWRVLGSCHAGLVLFGLLPILITPIEVLGGGSCVLIDSLANPETRGCAPAVVPENDLAAIRGGFKVGGLDLQFGVTLSTSIDGTLVLESLAGPVIPGATSDARDMAMHDSGGGTVVLHKINDDQVLGVVLNTANIQTITQRLDVDITITNFRQFQQVVRNSLLSSRLANSVN